MKLANVVIAARDLESMVEFYRELTGWPVFYSNEACCFLGSGAPFLALHRVTPETEVAVPEGSLCLDFFVDSLDAEATRLKNLGMEAETRSNMLVLRDPAGNLVELVPG
jgi:catechol 2,3-dioxygenase-like lactoylglutathione lyase family enzyme